VYSIAKRQFVPRRLQNIIHFGPFDILGKRSANYSMFKRSGVPHSKHKTTLRLESTRQHVKAIMLKKHYQNFLAPSVITSHQNMQEEQKTFSLKDNSLFAVAICVLSRWTGEYCVQHLVCFVVSLFTF
jgi:hypothetical protein